MDVFGRGKVAEARDNSLGAGSFERDCRTLYVNYSGVVSHMRTGLQARRVCKGVRWAGFDKLLRTVACRAPQAKQLLEPEFAEWGALARVHMAHDKRLAFVTYAQRSRRAARLGLVLAPTQRRGPHARRLYPRSPSAGARARASACMAPACRPHAAQRCSWRGTHPSTLHWHPPF